MNGKIFYPAFVFVVLTGLEACIEPVDLNLPVQDKTLAVVCHFSPLDTFELVLSRGHSVLDSGAAGVSYVPDAQVSIFSEGVLLDVLTYQPTLAGSEVPPHYKSSYFIPEEGKSYSLRVVVDDEEPVTAQSRVPPAVGVRQGSFAYDLDILEEDEFSLRANYELSFVIDDPPDTANFYHLIFYQEICNFLIDQNGDTIIQKVYSKPLRAEAQNAFLPLTPYIEGRGYLFKDDFFAGSFQEFSFSGTFLFSKSFQTLGHFVVELRSVPEEYYLYHTSLARYSRSLSDPLAPPVLVTGNVENAQGVFTGFSSRFYAL